MSINDEKLSQMGVPESLFIRLTTISHRWAMKISKKLYNFMSVKVLISKLHNRMMITTLQK